MGLVTSKSYSKLKSLLETKDKEFKEQISSIRNETAEIIRLQHEATSKEIGFLTKALIERNLEIQALKEFSINEFLSVRQDLLNTITEIKCERKILYDEVMKLSKDLHVQKGLRSLDHEIFEVKLKCLQNRIDELESKIDEQKTQSESLIGYQGSDEMTSSNRVKSWLKSQDFQPKHLDFLMKDSTIVTKIMTYLDPKSLLQCRQVSKSFMKFIDNQRSLVIFQLQQIRNMRIRIITATGRKQYSSLEEKYPQWSPILDEIQEKEKMEQLSSILKCLRENYKEMMHSDSCYELIDYVMDFDLVAFETVLKYSSKKRFTSQLHHACKFMNVQIVKLFMKYSRRKDFNEIHLGKHILHQACLNEKYGLEIVECLLTHAYVLDINVDATNDEGLTALQLAELNGDYDIVQLFKNCFYFQ